MSVLQSFHVFHDLDSLSGPGQVFCRVPLYWNLSGVFLMIRLKLCVLVRKAIEGKVPFSSYHIRMHTIDMTYH